MAQWTDFDFDHYYANCNLPLSMHVGHVTCLRCFQLAHKQIKCMWIMKWSVIVLHVGDQFNMRL